MRPRRMLHQARGRKPHVERLRARTEARGPARRARAGHAEPVRGRRRTGLFTRRARPWMRAALHGRHVPQRRRANPARRDGTLHGRADRTLAQRKRRALEHSGRGRAPKRPQRPRMPLRAGALPRPEPERPGPLAHPGACEPRRTVRPHAWQEPHPHRQPLRRRS